MRGRAVLALQARPLLDAELGLLVDDGGPELGELHPLADEGVGPDDEVDRTGLQAREHLPPPRRLGGARQQRGRGPPGAGGQVGGEALQESLELGGVLLGQHLRRHHQRALPARAARRRERQEGDDRLAAADVPLRCGWS